jgi:CheY-like chemotaxis protein
MTSFRVMVVDDDADVCESLGLLLRVMGHEVRVADGGDTAMECATEFKPEVVFLDIGMPGKDGYQVAEELRQLLRDAPPLLVSISGWGMASDFEKSKAAGFDHHLVKPASRQQIQAVLSSARLE